MSSTRPILLSSFVALILVGATNQIVLAEEEPDGRWGRLTECERDCYGAASWGECLDDCFEDFEDEDPTATAEPIHRLQACHERSVLMLLGCQDDCSSQVGWQWAGCLGNCLEDDNSRMDACHDEYALAFPESSESVAYDCHPLIWKYDPFCCQVEWDEQCDTFWAAPWWQQRLAAGLLDDIYPDNLECWDPLMGPWPDDEGCIELTRGSYAACTQCCDAQWAEGSPEWGQCRVLDCLGSANWLITNICSDPE